MKKNVLSVVFGLFVCASVFCSCATTSGYKGKAVIRGIVLDEKNNPVAGCLVRTDGLVSAYSDSNGMFSLNTIAAGNHTFNISCQGYGNSSLEYSIEDKTKLVCVQVNSLGALLNEIEDSLGCNDVEKAKSLFAAINPKDKKLSEVMFVESLIFYKDGNIAAAKKIFKRMNVKNKAASWYVTYSRELEGN